MNKGIKPLIEKELQNYAEDNLNGFIEYEDLDIMAIVEGVCIRTDIKDHMLVEELLYDIVDDFIREYNEGLQHARDIRETDRRERIASMGV